MIRTLAPFALALSFLVSAQAQAQEATPPATPATEAPAETPPADAAAPEAAPATGTLSISAEPNGKVFLNGVDTGLTTPVVDFAVPAGTHTLKVVDEATGREETTEFTIEAGGSLALNVALPEAAPAAEPAVAETPAVAADAPMAEVPKDEWTWMTVTGWAGLGLGTLALLSGAVVMTTPTDDTTLGFGLFGAGVGLVLGGGVLLYLDTELADSKGNDAAAPAPAR